MSEVRFVYIDGQTGLTKGTFRGTPDAALRLVRAELAKLHARNIVVQAGFKHVRNDGWPYASDRPAHSSVAVQFLDERGRTLVFRSTKYTTYASNLRAIGLTLHALRAVARYGVVSDGEQYTGFRQIEAAAGNVGDDKESKLRHMAEHGATQGERDAALAAIERMRTK